MTNLYNLINDGMHQKTVNLFLQIGLFDVLRWILSIDNALENFIK